jgi:hypothetical protein
MRIACWITKATDTLSENVILVTSRYRFKTLEETGISYPSGGSNTVSSVVQLEA